MGERGGDSADRQETTHPGSREEMSVKRRIHRCPALCLAVILVGILFLDHRTSFAAAGDEEFLEMLQRRTFTYFLDCTNPENGLVMDKADNFGPCPLDSSFASISGVGFGLAAMVVAAERGWISREEAERRTLVTLRFFWGRMTHEHGFFYHFVDMRTGKRFEKVELSSIDTALFIAGALVAASYYADPEIKLLAHRLYNRVDWQWMTNGGTFLSMGWTPEEGFLPFSWDHFSEGILMYIMAMGSPTHPLPASCWNLRRTWGKYGPHQLIACPPLFTHQFPQVFLDLRGLSDRFADYFQNSVQATLANRRFCLEGRASFKTFSDDCWGLTACIGPNGYQAYGASPGPAPVDGTVAPAAAACSIVFTPDLSIRALRYMYREWGDRILGRFGFTDSFNADPAFVAREAFAINQGPTILMIENYRSNLIWNLFMRNPCIQAGMRRAGFARNPNPRRRPTDGQILETNPYFPHQKPRLEAPRVSDTLTSAELWKDRSAWKVAPRVPFDLQHLQMFINPYRLATGECRLLHNRSTLFLLFRIEDRDLGNPFPDGEVFKGDSGEVYLDLDNDAFVWGGKRDVQLAFGPTPDGRKIRVKAFQPPGFAGAIEPRFSIRKDGYDLLLPIDKAAFGIGPGEIGFSVALHDVEPAGRKDVKWQWFFTQPVIHLGALRFGAESGMKDGR